MKSSKYTQAGDPSTVGEEDLDRPGNSAELLLQYEFPAETAVFEVNPGPGEAARYLVPSGPPVGGQEFEMMCRCPGDMRASHQNIVLTSNRMFQCGPEHSDYPQQNMDRKILTHSHHPHSSHSSHPSPIPRDAPAPPMMRQRPELITVHRVSYPSGTSSGLAGPAGYLGQANHVGDYGYDKQFVKCLDDQYASFRRPRKDFARASNRSFQYKRRSAADGTDSEPEQDEPELLFELAEHLGDCRCACDPLAYSPAYNTTLQDDRFPPAPDVTRRLGSTATLSKADGTFYRSSGSMPGTSNSSSTGSASSRVDLSSRHWWVIVTVLLLAAAAGVGVPIALRINAGATFDERLEMASRLLQETPLVDGHNDLPWNIRKFLHNRLRDFRFGEDLRNVSPWSQSAWSHTDLPRLKRGHVSAQFWAAYVPCEAQYKDAVQLTLEQIDVIRRLTDQYQPSLTLCTSATDIKTAHEKQQMCSLIGVEGGHSLANSLAVLRTLYHVGVRYLTLTSTCNTPWADCSHADQPGKKAEHGGLTNFGKNVVKEMNRLGMIVDLSHVSVGTMRDALDVSKAPVIFSHSSAHALCNSTRNVPDATLRRLALNRGIIMLNFYSHFLTCKEESTVADAVAHINHIRDIAGVDNVGLGAGYDGINFTPRGLEDVSSYPTLFAELIGTGRWSTEDLQKLAGLNFLRVFREVERVRDEFQQAKVPPYEEVITPRPKDNNCSSQD